MLIDTPGFYDVTLSDTDISKLIAAFQERLARHQDVGEAREWELATNILKPVRDKGT